MRNLLLLPAGVLLIGFVAEGAQSRHYFEKTKLTNEFWSEGAHYGDFNRDGKVDVVSGPFWYEAPEFKVRHEFRPAEASFKRKNVDGDEETLPGYEGAMGTNNAYSDNFLTFTWDFNNDGWIDIMVYGWPGKEAIWYQNPGNTRKGHWEGHVAIKVLDNESPGFGDVTGDGKPEILCCSEGYLGYGEADWNNPAAPWKFRAVTPKGAYERYTHGLGIGDINGDGRVDILEKDGWWEQPKSLEGAPIWKKHPVAFAPSAAQILVYDVNGDKLNDVITAVDAHGYGLVWHEQSQKEQQVLFREHVILNKDATKNTDGIQFSQVHALYLVDIDEDGLQDVVTGKRFWAHGPNGDPEPNAPAVLYWFQLRRERGAARFVPHLIDDDSGVGTQVIAGPITDPKLHDIVVGNKKGTFLFKHRRHD